MATFSPMPRRTSRYSSIGSPSPPRQGPPGRRTRAGSAQPQSRFSTPRRNGPLAPIRDDESLASGSGMDIDEEGREWGPKGDTVYSKSKEMTVSFYAQLPMEVRQALRSADFLREGYTGDVDPVSGFASVVSLQTCFVWKYSQALTGTPTCYIFNCPELLDSLPMATHFHALVPYGQQREPGLVICSYVGQVRFWDSIGMGLAGGENFSSYALPINDEEMITALTRVDSQTYVVSTSIGRLFRLTVTSSGGKYHLSTHVFGRPSSSLSLSKMLGFWSTPELQPQPGNINAVGVCDLSPGATGRVVWAIVDTRLQQWNMSVEGWEELLLEEEIGEQVRNAVRKQFPTASAEDVELDLELLDLKIQGSRDMVMLVSFAGREDGSSQESRTHPRRVYAILSFKYLPGTFQILRVQAVPYQSTSSSGAPIHPRVQVVIPEHLLAVQFGDAVTICSQNSEYMDRLELKSSTDRTLGVGVDTDDRSLLVLTATTMMKTTVDLREVARFHPAKGRAELIKSTMMKAILYGSLPENPLYFSFPPEIDEEALMSGAEQLSEAVLESDPEVVQTQHDLTAQMTARKERLSFLIKFINDNSALAKMSQRSRQSLATDAEKLYAAHQLWLQQNEALRGGHAQYNTLHQAVYYYMNAMGEGHHEDCLRAFLRLRVRDIVELLPHVLDMVHRSLSNTNTNLPEVISQANLIVLTMLQGARSYREYNLGVYGIVLPIINAWTSQLSVIDIVNELFDLTTQLVETPASDPETNNTKRLPKSQLPELASCLFKCFQERLDWLESAMAPDDSGAEREQLFGRFRQLRPAVLEVLRRNDFAEEAFKLAEEYHDFRSLASLCHKGKVYPPQDNPNAARIEHYIQRFRQAFTNELYQWYIEHGELRTLFAQEHIEYLDQFFAEHSYPNISWIHDLGRGRFGLASQCLQSEAEHAPELVSKHLMLSMGKLSHLAQLHDGETAINQDTLDAFHDGLDFVSVHETLVVDFKSALASARSRQSLEMQVETIAQSRASRLSTRKSLYNVFKYLVRLLLQGKALSIEDMADVLSLKDNKYHVEDYTTALHLLARAEDLPKTRRLNSFRNVWRRILIHDDWNHILQTTGVSDEELNDRLRSTALYTALSAIAHRKERPQGYKMTSREAMEVPSEEDIALRWPSLSPEEIVGIAIDYQRESNMLADLNLDAMYQTIEQLIAVDMQRA